MADHDGNHRCLVEKNVPKALILPSRWQDDAESLEKETSSCLWIRQWIKQWPRISTQYQLLKE